jgi:hypothetical protein
MEYLLWTDLDILLSPKVDGIYQGSLVVVYILWILKNAKD